MKERTFEPHVRAFLDAEPARFAVLATIDEDGSPHQAVIWYLVEDAAIIVNSLEGRRWPANLRRDARCSLMVEDGMDYVAVRATAEPVGDPASAQADIAAMARRYEPPEEAERLIRDRFQPQQRVSFRLRPRSVSVHGEVG